MSEAEREHLDNQLRQVNEDFPELAVKVVLLALVAGLCVFAAIMAALGRDRSGPVGVCLGAVVGVIVHVLLFYHVAAFIFARRERRELREALADGAAVVERIEASAGTNLLDRGGVWHLLQVGEQRLFALPERQAGLVYHGPGFLEPAQVAACFELVSTRRNGLPLGLVEHGQTFLRLPPTRLDELIADSWTRRQAAARLTVARCFSGNLNALSDALGRLLVEAPFQPETNPLALTWGGIQAEIEEQFSINFGSAGLETELARLGADKPLTARNLLAVVRRRLPAGASYSARPLRGVFLRLRAALAEECGVRPECIKPSTRLEEVVPRRERSAVWDRLAHRLGQGLPPFAQRDTPLAVGIVAGLGILVVYAVGVPTVQAIDSFAIDRGFDRSWWFYSMGVCLVPTSFVAGMVLSIAGAMWLFRNRYPPAFRADCRTVGDLTRSLAETVEGVMIPWTEEAAWPALRGVLARASGREPLAVVQETKLIEELGLPGARGAG